METNSTGNQMKRADEKEFFGDYKEIPYLEAVLDYIDETKLDNYVGDFHPFIEDFMNMYQDGTLTPNLIKYFRSNEKVRNTVGLIQLGRLTWALEVLDRGYKKFEREYVSIDTWFMVLVRAKGLTVSSSLRKNIDKFFESKVDIDYFDFPETDKAYLGIYDGGVGVEYHKDLVCLENKGYATSELYSLDLALFKFLSIRLNAYSKINSSKKLTRLIGFFDTYKNKADYTKEELTENFILLSEVLPNIFIDK